MQCACYLSAFNLCPASILTWISTSCRALQTGDQEVHHGLSDDALPHGAPVRLLLC